MITHDLKYPKKIGNSSVTLCYETGANISSRILSALADSCVVTISKKSGGIFTAQVKDIIEINETDKEIVMRLVIRPKEEGASR